MSTLVQRIADLASAIAGQIKISARAAISATGSLSYNSTTGVISYTAPAAATYGDLAVGTDNAKIVTAKTIADAGAIVSATGSGSWHLIFRRESRFGGSQTAPRRSPTRRTACLDGPMPSC